MMREAFGFLYAICALLTVGLFVGHIISAGMNGARAAGCELLIGSMVFAMAAFSFLKISELAP